MYFHWLKQDYPPCIVNFLFSIRSCHWWKILTNWILRYNIVAIIASQPGKNVHDPRWRNMQESLGNFMLPCPSDFQDFFTKVIFRGIMTELCPWILCSPYRIVDDCGGAFMMGAIGGGIFSFVKGWRNSPAVSFVPLPFFVCRFFLSDVIPNKVVICIVYNWTSYAK